MVNREQSLIARLASRIGSDSLRTILNEENRIPRNHPMVGPASLPDGTVTFLFSDVQGSTRLWEEHPEPMRVALVRHDRIVESCTCRNQGCVVKPRGEGDSHFCVFARALDGVMAAAAIQRALREESWPTPTPILVRLALHTGYAELREGSYYGSAVNRCARLRSVAHGGQTLLSGATQDRVRDELRPAYDVKDLGEHRLKDLTAPERIYQLSIPGLPDEFPPLPTFNFRPSNLPAQLNSFIGRERESAEVTGLLAGEGGDRPSGIRLLTLTGPGGTGKTRLALQVAGGLTERFPDGVWFVEMAALSDPSLVPQTVASAIGLRDTSGRPPMELLKRHLASKQMLLLLDNCEHLVAACADLSDVLLRASPRLQLLATSREALRVEGETTWPVPSLSVPATAVGPLDRVAPGPLGQFESVRLFVERARAVTPGFALSEQNAGAVAELCQRLDGIPLAIELAAARTRHLSLDQLLVRVQDRFRLLTGGSRAALPRQQTLRALVDWSYDLLSPQERLLFDRLSVFAGGWTLAAAEAVCADEEGADRPGEPGPTGRVRAEDIVDLLGHLLDKSMLIAERLADGVPRYRLLETLRQYGQERLALGGPAAHEAWRARHTAYFVALGEQVAAAMHGPDQPKWSDRLEVEHDNIRSALEWGKAPEAPPDRVELVLRLAASLYLPWFRRGHGREERQHFETLLAHPNAQRPTSARAGVLFSVGSLALWQDGDAATAWALLSESLALAERLGDTRVMAEARHNLGVVLHNRGDIAAARLQHEEALRLTRADGDLSGIRWSLEDLADLMADEGDTAGAATLYDQALSLARQTGDQHGIGSILQSMGALARAAGKSGLARDLFGEGLGIMQRIGCHHCCARHLVDLALLADTAGEPERAVRLLGAAEALRERTGIVMPAAWVEPIGQAMEKARQGLGGTLYSAVWSDGRTMALPQITAYAMGSFSPLVATPEI